ncbi:MAG: protein kinase, partial [Myxococcales bacterium]|nr:protein kinase [Myxococcales bacterium]
MSDPLRGRIAALRAEGRHADAAKLALDAGDPERAATLFAQVWRWPEAQAAARRAGRLDRAYAYAIAGDDRSMTREVIAALADDPNQARLAAAHAEAKGRARDAAQLFEHALELGEAARLYEAAGELGEAARCQEARGAHREAGRLYERRVREHPSDAAAALSLGRILIRFARYEPAAKALQGAEADPAHAPAALGLLVGVFQAMGMAEAASSCLDRLRLLRPELPIEVPEALRALYGDPRGLLGGEEQAELLGGRYRVCQRLGAGATGRVVLARDVFHERDVAIKILNVSAGSAGRDAYERFAREARIAAAMEHPNLLRVYEYDPSGPYIVMEPMMGGTLEERLEASEAADRRLSLGLIRQVLSALLRGLEAVHRRGVIHRDIKPANIFFDAAGGVKLGDFGVAHLSDLGTTRTGAMMGTLAYMAPEQLTGAGLPSPATDLYALGIVAYRMLAGRLPFPGPDFVTQHLRDAPPPLRALAPGILPALASLVMALLEKEADARP